MSFLDDVMKAGMPAAAPQPAELTGQHAAMAQAVLGMLNQPGGGGLGSLLQGFQQGGLGHLAQSWISTGPNQAASPQQIEQGLGGNLLNQLAQKVGVSPQVASAILAVVLPMIIDKLTPHGNVPTQDALSSVLGGLLGGPGGANSGLGGLGGLLGGLLNQK